LKSILLAALSLLPVLVLRAEDLPLEAYTDILPGIPEEKVFESFSSRFAEGGPSADFRGDGFFRFIPSARFLSPAPRDRDGAWILYDSLRTGQAEIRFPEKPVGDRLVSISIWVFSMDYPGSLYLLIRDGRGVLSRHSFGSLRYSGWKKLTVAIPDSVFQRDYSVSSAQNAVISGLLYTPGPAGNNKRLLMIDSLSITVRRKYLLKEY